MCVHVTRGIHTQHTSISGDSYQIEEKKKTIITTDAHSYQYTGLHKIPLIQVDNVYVLPVCYNSIR